MQDAAREVAWLFPPGVGSCAPQRSRHRPQAHDPEQQGFAGFASYVAAKSAVGGLTRAAAREWGRHGINVNAIVPFSLSEGTLSALDEQQVAAVLRQLSIRRSGDAERDIGRAAVYLAGPDSSYVTGTTLMLDGGGAFFS